MTVKAGDVAYANPDFLGWEWVGDQGISKFFGRTPIFDNFTM